MQQTTNSKIDQDVIDRLPEQAGSPTLEQRLPYVLISVFLLFFLWESYQSAKHNPLWMDEILATWTIRMPSMAAIWSAVQRGSDFSPPTYHASMHVLAGLTGYSYTMLRAPSVVGILISGCCLFLFLRRYLGLSPAAFALCWSLLGVLSTFGTQVRPYALVTACFSLALLCWDRLNLDRPRLGLITLMAVLLATASFLHFYAVLFVPLYAIMEAIYSFVHKRIRLSVWIALFMAGATSLLWLPLIRTISSLNKGDTASYGYYAKPTIRALHDTYIHYLIFDDKQEMFLLATLIGLAAGVIAQRYAPVELKPENASPHRLNLYIAAFSMTAFPLVTLVFAALVTRTFNLRYSLVASLGFACIFAIVLAKIPIFTRVVSPILLAGCALALTHSYPIGTDTWDLIHLVQKGNQAYPLVISEGLQYLQIQEAAPAGLQSRLFFLTSAPGFESADPTNENQVKRWGVIRPELHIEPAMDFYRQNPHFYLLHTEQSTDNVSDALLAKHLIGKPVAHDGSKWLFDVELDPALR